MPKIAGVMTSKDPMISSRTKEEEFAPPCNGIKTHQQERFFF
jgi:hypothetical protein